APCRSFFYLSPPPPPSSLFPYTTLFRSSTSSPAARSSPRGGRPRPPARPASPRAEGSTCDSPATRDPRSLPSTVNSNGVTGRGRSEEHTSELQSRENLVCRLLLEKKNRR